MSDLQAAANIVRENDSGKIATYGQQERDSYLDALGVLARQYLAEQDEDSELPITEEWLRSVGVLRVGDDGGKGYSPGRRQIHTFFVVWFAESWQACSEDSRGDQWYFGDKETRGELRRLCSALGIELKENQ